MDASFWRRLWTCRQTEYWMNELLPLSFECDSLQSRRWLKKFWKNFTWILEVKLNFYTALATTSLNTLCHNPQYYRLDFRSYSCISLTFLTYVLLLLNLTVHKKWRKISWHPTLTFNIPSLARQRCLPSWGPRRTPWFFCNFSTVWYGRLLKLRFLGFWIYNSVIQALLASNILCLFISTEVTGGTELLHTH